MGEYWVIRHVDGTYGHSVKGRVQRARDAETLSREEAHAYRKKWNPGGGQLFVVHVTTKPREKGDPDDVRELYRASENQRAAITAERDALKREVESLCSWRDLADERLETIRAVQGQLAETQDQLTIAVRQRVAAEKEAASHGRTARDLAYGFEQRVKAACDATLAMERRYLAKRYENVYGGYVVEDVDIDIARRITEKKGAGEG